MQSPENSQPRTVQVLIALPHTTVHAAEGEARRLGLSVEQYIDRALLAHSAPGSSGPPSVQEGDLEPLFETGRLHEVQGYPPSA